MKAMLSALDRLNWHDGLAPGHERRNGVLALGGVAATELADAYGTPLHVIDFDVLDAAVAALTALCAPLQVTIAYAGKALLVTALARRLTSTALQLDVCSIGELVTAERAGFPAARITLHGSGKTGDELDAAASGRVGMVVADSVDEVEQLIARPSGARPLEVMIRVNTGVEVDTHAFVQTGGARTKFGLPPDAVARAAGLVRDAVTLRFAGLHAHIGSQIFEPSAFVANAEALVEVAALLRAREGITCGYINVGGGFGVQTAPDGDSSLDIASAIAAVASAVAASARRLGIAQPGLGIEPGRALIGPAGTSLYRVVAVKRQGDRTFVVIDGGLADNPRPAIYGAYHHAISASRQTRDDELVTVCGRSCENDELGPAHLPKDVHTGDLIALCTTGAYTYSMASNYNRFARPPLVAVESGRHSLLARRQSLDEVLQDDA
jgi:diaminopimelate decarboxylase